MSLIDPLVSEAGDSQWTSPRAQPLRAYDGAVTFASHLVQRGASLYLVGKLIGHTQAATTQRYAHVADAALRAVTNDFAKVLEMPKPRTA